MTLILRKETPNITRYKLKPQYKNLLMSIEALPGVHVISATFDKMNKHLKGLLIFLHIEEGKQEGLFFLTRSIDRRYWEFGNKWQIQMEVGDTLYENGDRPITYFIWRAFEDSDTEQTILDECKSLTDNMNHHFNHDGFMKSFNMKSEGYHVVDEVAFERRTKLEDLGIN